jgi:hypothetical protein
MMMMKLFKIEKLIKTCKKLESLDFIKQTQSENGKTYNNILFK